MHHSRRVLLVLALAAVAFAQEGSREPALAKASDDLARYYGEQKAVPPYREAIVDLENEDVSRRKEAGAYLLALFQQSLADESNGRAPWRSLPTWGGGSECDARKIRQAIAQSFGSGAQGDEALQCAVWLVEQEPLAENQAQGAAVLRRLSSPAAVEAYRKVLAAPFLNEKVALELLLGVTEHSLDGLADVVLPLCTSYRKAVRDKAAATAERLHLSPVPAFDPEKAFTPWLAEQVSRTARLIPSPLPKDARFARVRSKGDEGRWVSAWILREDETTLRLLDEFGEEREVAAKDVDVSERTLAEEAQALVDLRGGSSREDAGTLSRRGSLSGQFEARFVSLPEMLVAAWCFERGDRKSAASILFPRIDETEDDRWVFWVARDLVGHACHQRMLEAFSRARDYAEAIRLAQHLSLDLFDGYQYQERAKELATQLAKRGQDFHEFRLPTPTEWKTLTERLGRQEQVRYLGERLRLLNCFQWGSPGGVSYEDRQYAEPYDGGDSVEVVNPYVELRRMRLAVADLPALVPLLADESFMPTYSFWRDFHPSRTLHRANWAVADIVNSVARRDLADLGTFGNLDEAGKKKHLEGILEWCKAHAAQTPAELAMEVLRTTADWAEFSTAAEEAVGKRYDGALKVLVARAKDFPKQRGRVARLVHDLGSPGAVPSAREWLASSDKESRFWASLILVEHGDAAREEGLAELNGILQEDDGSEWYPWATRALVRVPRQATLDVACRVLDRPRFEWEWNGDLVWSLFRAGRREALEFMLRKLASDKSAGTTHFEKDGKQETRTIYEYDNAAELVAGWKMESFPYSTSESAEDREAKRKVLGNWLREQFGRIEAGQEPEMKEPAGAPPEGEWQIDAPR